LLGVLKAVGCDEWPIDAFQSSIVNRQSSIIMFPLKDDNPTTIVPVVTLILIAINVAVFLYQVSLKPPALQLFIYEYGTVPALVTGAKSLPESLAKIPPFLSIFSSMFLHGGWMHLIGNLWFLWIFGNNIEEAMGGLRYLLFYLACGFIASLCQIFWNVRSVLPTVGASGAIAGVLGAYVMLYPRARVLVLIFLGFFIRVLYIPAGVVLGFWFLIQLLSGSEAGKQDMGGVAFWAHIGGFVAGALLIGLFKKKGIHFFNPPRQAG
jgi:membrane associated rhomboid family serine protease